MEWKYYAERAQIIPRFTNSIQARDLKKTLFSLSIIERKVKVFMDPIQPESEYYTK